ncbi:hypothetical protein C8R45DRAFT_1083983, partial [Mycena sanguinolenta]
MPLYRMNFARLEELSAFARGSNGTDDWPAIAEHPPTPGRRHLWGYKFPEQNPSSHIPIVNLSQSVSYAELFTFCPVLDPQICGFSFPTTFRVEEPSKQFVDVAAISCGKDLRARGTMNVGTSVDRKAGGPYENRSRSNEPTVRLGLDTGPPAGTQRATRTRTRQYRTRPTRGPQTRTGHPRVLRYPRYLRPVGSTRGMPLQKGGHAILFEVSA